MPIRSRESPFFLGGLLVMFAVAAALIGGGGPARRAHGDAPLFRQFVPGVASDSADPASPASARATSPATWVSRAR